MLLQHSGTNVRKYFILIRDDFHVGKMQVTTIFEMQIVYVGNDVVLGPDQPICYSRTDTGIPAEQAVCKQKLRPGSGRLSLTVDTDGPTRVLRVVDVEKPPRSKMLHHKFEETTFNTIPKLLANVCLRSGLGVSIVNCKPREELVYIRLTS